MAKPPEKGNTPSSEKFTSILKQIQFDDPATIAKKETGKSISEAIYKEQTGQDNNLNFFTARALRWNNILKWASGTQDMTEFLPFFNISDANKALTKMDMTPVMIGPQFVGTLVESMSKNEEYPCVTAIDDNSVKEKEDRKYDALYRMHDLKTISDVQKQSGIQLEPTNAYVPDDAITAEVYYQLEDRLPKEIRFEKILENTLTQNQYERVLKRRQLYDLITCNMTATKIEKDSGYGYCIRKCISQNMFYNWFLGDTGKQELSYIGEVYNLKVRDIREKYGYSSENPDGLTEKDIFELAKMSTTRNTGIGFGFLWKDQFTIYNNNRPWDDYSVYVQDFEILISEPEYYVSKTDNYGKENIAPKKSKPEPKSDRAKVIKKTKSRWWRGVYAPYGNTMLYWGKPELTLLNYDKTSESLSSYSINIPNNTGDYVPSLFERALEPLREYALTKLKRKQLIAKLRPAGIRIDIESARNIDLGGGNTIPWEEIIRIYDNTGVEVWSSRGLNPNEREAPAISQTAADDTINKIIQLTDVLSSCLMEIRGLLGVPNYRDGADVGDRTAGKLAEQQYTSSFNVTDYVLNGQNQVMEETLYKICLLEWQEAVKEDKEGDEDLINTKFKVYVKMLPTAYEKQMLEQNIQIAMRAMDRNGKPLLSFKDAFKIRNIKNYKLAELYLSNMIEQNEKKSMQESMQLQQQNADVQAQAAQQAAQAQDKMQQDKLMMDEQKMTVEGKVKKETILLQGMMEIYKVLLTPKVGGEGTVAANQSPAPVPPELQQLFSMISQNIAIPLLQENKQMQQMIAAQAQQEQMAQQQQQEQPEPQMQ